MLHLPHVAELVAEEIFIFGRLAQEDRGPRGVSIEAPEPRQPEEERRHEDVHMRDPHWLRVEVEPVEPGLGALEEL